MKNGEISSVAGSTVVYACEYAEEASQDNLELWQNLEQIIQNDWIIWLSDKFSSNSYFGHYLESLYVIRKTSHFECVYFLLRLLERVNKAKETVVPVGPQALRFLDVELAKTKESVVDYIGLMNNTDPELYRLYQTKRAAKDVIFQRIAILRSFYKDGLLSKEVILVGIPRGRQTRKKTPA